MFVGTDIVIGRKNVMMETPKIGMDVGVIAMWSQDTSVRMLVEFILRSGVNVAGLGVATDGQTMMKNAMMETMLMEMAVTNFVMKKRALFAL